MQIKERKIEQEIENVKKYEEKKIGAEKEKRERINKESTVNVKTERECY